MKQEPIDQEFTNSQAPSSTTSSHYNNNAGANNNSYSNNRVSRNSNSNGPFPTAAAAGGVGMGMGAAGGRPSSTGSTMNDGFDSRPVSAAAELDAGGGSLAAALGLAPSFRTAAAPRPQAPPAAYTEGVWLCACGEALQTETSVVSLYRLWRTQR